jgi:Ribbon-helix-helix domain
MAGLRRKGRKPNSSDRLRKAQLSFYPEPHDYARLRALSARTGVPQQVYLRAGLDFVLQTYDAVAAKRAR